MSTDGTPEHPFEDINADLKAMQTRLMFAQIIGAALMARRPVQEAAPPAEKPVDARARKSSEKKRRQMAKSSRRKNRKR